MNVSDFAVGEVGGEALEEVRDGVEVELPGEGTGFGIRGLRFSERGLKEVVACTRGYD